MEQLISSSEVAWDICYEATRKLKKLQHLSQLQYGQLISKNLSNSSAKILPQR